MPILKVKVSAPRSATLTRQITDQLLELTHRILHKKPALTAIVIDYVDPDCWLIGGRSLRELGKASFYFDIKITDETNTKDEKAQYIREAFAAFEALLGELHGESYIHIEDVRASAYGYGGLTQERRYHQPG